MFIRTANGIIGIVYTILVVPIYNRFDSLTLYECGVYLVSQCLQSMRQFSPFENSFVAQCHVSVSMSDALATVMLLVSAQ